MSTKDLDGQTNNSSKTFIESIGIDFYISEDLIETAVVTLTPQGDFYYRVLPTLDEQRSSMLREINESSNESTYASHYESFLRYYIKNISKSKRDVKVIGATATISSYKEQVYHLYGRNPIRFPSESPFIERNFYAFIDKNDLQRQILGYAPYGKAIVNSVVYSLKYMREAVFEYYQNPAKILDIPDVGISTVDEALELLKDYT